jgi:hypothetical protein
LLEIAQQGTGFIKTSEKPSYLRYTKHITSGKIQPMKQFWIEGLVKAKAGAGSKKAAPIKPFSQSYWAETAQEALQMATLSMPGIQWIEGPLVSDESEEQHMRQLGAPELFKTSATTKKKKSY